jgi:flagellin
MRINHNIAALNTYRQLSANTVNTSKSLEKLSSGLRINRAGDDAAGLAISEKMRSQIRGLDTAARNANDGISLIQTAEGALNETHSILQRMKELAVQAANDTNTAEDRAEIQKEIDQLTTEITRIAANTEFNTKKLLDGSMAATASTDIDGVSASLVAGSTLESGIYNVSIEYTDSVPASNATKTGNYKGAQSGTFVYDGETWKDSSDYVLDLTANGGDLAVTNAKVGDKLIVTAYEPAVEFAAGTPGGAEVGTTTGINNISNIAVTGLTFTALEGQVPAVDHGEDAYTATITFTWNEIDSWDITNGETSIKSGVSTDDLRNDYGITFEGEPGEGTAEEFTVKLTGTINDREAVSESGGDSTLVRAAAVEEQAVVTITDELGNSVSANNFEFKYADSVVTGTLTGTVTVDSSKSMIFHIGANESQNTSLSINNMDAESLGVNALDLTEQSEADKAITTIDNAISKVSSQRAALGAMQNRLEHTINNLGTASENLSAAESRIRDVDMAKEMMEFTKNNILSQASQAMLAQANMQPQSVLQLLQ